MNLRARVVAGLLLGAAAVSGCATDVRTEVTVTGPSTAQIEVQAVFTGEAADQIAEDAETRASLLRVFATRVGSTPEVALGKHRVVTTVAVSYDELTESSDVTGVAALRLTDSGGSASATIVDPEELQRALTAEIQDEDDAAALTQTLLAQTSLTVAITYPGGVESASVSRRGENLTTGLKTTSTTASYTRTALSSDPVVLEVSGDPTPSIGQRLSSTIGWLLGSTSGRVGLAVGGLMAAGVVLVRRMRYEN